MQRVFLLLDADYDGVVSREDFERQQQQQHMDASVAAGGARAGIIQLMRTMIRSIPQMPAVKFFRQVNNGKNKNKL